MIRFVFIFTACFGCLFASYLDSKDGVSDKELSFYFYQFLEDFPVVKFSGFFSKNDNANVGLHISNCKDNICDVYYNDYTQFNHKYTPIPECKSSDKLEVINSTKAKVGNAILTIKGSSLAIKGEIRFECNPNRINSNISKVMAIIESNNSVDNLAKSLKHTPAQMTTDRLIENATPYKLPDGAKFSNETFYINEKWWGDEVCDEVEEDKYAYQISIKDEVLDVGAVYPINLNCINRGDFSSNELCAAPKLGDLYSFSQFFIYLAREKPEAFYQPSQVVLNYRAMQDSISKCEYQGRAHECISNALDRFEEHIKRNLIIDNFTEERMAYRLLR